MELPKLNTKYKFFDDGKIKHSRLYEVEILETIPFSDIDKKTMKLWQEEVACCHHLYKKSTDYFVKGYIPDVDEYVFFVRCIENKWFSLGEWGGRLDLDGALFKQLESRNLSNK